MGLLELFLPTASPCGFAKRVTSALRRQGYDGPIRYEPQAFALYLGEGEKASTSFLRNTYQTYVRAPRSARSAVIRDFAKVILTTPLTPETFEQAAPNLLPRMRERFYYEALSLQAQLGMMESLTIPTVPVTEHLRAEFAIDSELSIATVSDKVYADWAVSPEQVRERARENLWKISNKNFDQPMPGLYLSAWQDSWDASRMLLHDLIWQLKVKGSHVAVAPHRDLLIVTGSEDAEGLAALADLAERQLEHARAMSPFPAVLMGTQWTDFNPAADAPGYPAIHRLRLIAQARDYAEQKNLLDALDRKNEVDRFNASCSVVEKTSGVIFSYCAWTRDVLALLPKTEKIIFGGSEGDPKDDAPMMADWDAAAAVMNDQLRPVGMYPERYRVDGYPSESQLKSMQAERL